MAKDGRKKLAPPTGSAWQSTLDRIEGSEPTQAGEIEPGCEDGRGGGDKGIDAETGSGGYGGDAVEAGHDAALAEPERPLDREIQGDPRTPEGVSYPDELEVADDDLESPDEDDIDEDDDLDDEEDEEDEVSDDEEEEKR